jgi:type II secretory pathway pseudopilin PulG
MKKNQLQSRKGFTMGDVLIALTLVGIASAIAYGLYAGVTTSANTSAGTANARYLTKLYGEFQNAGGTPAGFVDGASNPLALINGAGVSAGGITFKLPGNWTRAQYTVDANGVFTFDGGTP